MRFPSEGWNRTLARLVAALSFVLLVAGSVAAQPARLSADLTELLAENASSIDVIVHGSPGEVAALASKYGGRVIKYLTAGGGVLRVTAEQLRALQQDGSQDHLSSDVPIVSSAILPAQSIRADSVWAGSDGVPPLSGAGIGIAIIDSGIDDEHETLWEKVAVSVDFTGGDGIDRFGHGTHIAATIAGQQTWLADGTEFRGIAYGAHLINLRVLDDTGSGRASSVIEAIDWAIEHRRQYQIRVINLSLGAPVLQPYRDDPLCEAVERAVEAGLLVVTSAGNQGAYWYGRFGTITSPANHPAVIAVGALDTHGTVLRADDTVAEYSSRGPTLYDLVVKPDLAAPGSGVVSATVAAGFLVAAHPESPVIGEGDHAYIELSGTSMAAAAVSGAASLLLELEPSLTAAEVKLVLQATSTPTVEGVLAAGAGSINVAAAAQMLAAWQSSR